MEQNIIQNENVNQEDVQFVQILAHYLSYWKLFAISVVAFLCIAFVYLRYSTPQYQVFSKIMISGEKGEAAGIDPTTAFKDIGIVKPQRNIEDEIEVLTSTSLAKSVKDSLRLSVSYFKSGKLKSKEIYKETPVWVSIPNILKFGSFTINKNKNGEYEIYSDDAKFKQKTKLGESLNTPWGVITLSENPFGTASFPIGVSIGGGGFSLQVTQPKKSANTLVLSTVTITPEKGKDIINTLINHYNQDAIMTKNYQAQKTVDFITERLHDISGELKSAELDVENYKQREGITSLEAQGQILLSSAHDYDKRIKDGEIQLQILRSIKSFITSNTDNADNIIPVNVGLTDPTILGLISAYNNQVQTKMKETAGMTATNPEIANHDRRIALLRDNLLTGINVAESSAELSLKEMRRQENAYLGQTHSLSTQERQTRELLRQQNIKETLFIYLSQKMEETALSLVLATPNAKIINPVACSSTPISPKRNMIWLGALVLGLLIPFAYVYVKDLLDNKIHTKDDIVKRVKAPFLGDIPKDSEKEIDNPFPVLKEHSYLLEKFRIITSNLEFISASEREKVIAVTSMVAGEGKSFVSPNLALSLAVGGKKVLLIDLDLRKSVLSKLLSIKKEKGSALFLSDDSLTVDDIIERSTYHPNLDIIPVKVYPPNPAELLSTNRLDLLFDEIKGKYDYVIVDTAPIGLVADAYRINKFTNATIFVVRADYSYKQSLNEIRELYQDNKLHQITCIMNASSRSKRYGYYGYGGQYKHDYYRN